MFSFHFGEQFRHGGVEGGRQLLDDLDGGHALAALQQTEVLAMQVGLAGECFLRETGGLASTVKDRPELLLQRMHGTNDTTKTGSALFEEEGNGSFFFVAWPLRQAIEEIGQ